MVKRSLKPPSGLEPPSWVDSWLGRRDEVILDHGFTADQLLPSWWDEKLEAAGLRGHSIAIPSYDGGAPRLTRRDLFVMASDLEEGSPDDDYLRLLWHVLVWGSGRSRRNNLQRIAAFADLELRQERVALLRSATVAAREGDAATAYGTLIRRGGGKIPGLGPAFFTKFLYFVGSGNAAHSCLILDARVAKSLHTAGWSTIPSGSYNWYTETYVAYCELLTRWAEAATSTTGKPIAADEFERALFAGNPL